MNENFQINLSKDALEDILEAIERYERFKEGLGYDFDVEINARMNDVGQNPYLCQKIYGEVRAAHLKRFPFSIFYWINEHQETVNVFAVRPQANDPQRWKRRL